VLEFHITFGWVLIGVNAFAGAWCLLAYRFPTLRGRPMWGTVIVAQLTPFVQAFIGAVYSQRPGVELRDMHALYGFSGIIAVGILYSYRSSGFIKGKETLLYGCGCLFIMGLGLRELVL